MTKRSQRSRENFLLDQETNDPIIPSSSKRVRFTGSIYEANTKDLGDEDGYDSEDELLELAKRRRGGVKLEGYNSDETDTDDDGAALYNRRKGISGTDRSNVVDDDMDDMFADDSVESSKKSSGFKPGGKKDVYLELDEIDGQDYTSFDAYDESGEPIIEAFNLKVELEEGRFDEAGNYIRNKDPNGFHDNWLEGVSRGDIEKARVAHEKQERERKIKQAKDSNEFMDRVAICKELLTIMKRGETLLDTFKRLGGSAGSKTKIKRGPKQYSKKPKGKNSETQPPPPPEEERELTHEEKLEQHRVKLIERLTDLSVMAMEHFDVYEDTWEQILRNLKREGAVPEDWVPLGVNEDTLSENQPTSQEISNNELTVSQWEYKWAGKSDGEVGETYGPFSGEDMKAWNDQGYFANGILVRKLGSGDEFISATDIDFLA